MTESKVLQCIMTVEELKAQGNGIVAKLNEMDRLQLIDKALEAHYMMQILIKTVIEAGLITAESLQQQAEEIQSLDLGLVDKPDGVVGAGSIAMIKFKFSHEGVVIEDRTTAPLAYHVGSRAMPIDDEMLGMKAGDTKTIDVNFGPDFPNRALADKPLKMELAVVGVKVRERAAT